MRKNYLGVLLPAVLGLVLLTDTGPALAQYGYGYHGGGGYGYGPPPPRPRWGYRHRIHGYVGAQATGIGVINQRTDGETQGYLGAGGGGGGLFGGIRLGPFFSLELNWNITYHNGAYYDDPIYDYYRGWSAFHLQTVELDGKVHIPTRGPVEPFFQLGVGFAFLGVSWDDAYWGESGDYVFSSGVDFNVGGGLDIWLSPFVSVGGRLLYKGMRFGETKEYQTQSGRTVRGPTNFASAITADINVALHF